MRRLSALTRKLQKQAAEHCLREESACGLWDASESGADNVMGASRRSFSPLTNCNPLLFFCLVDY